MESHLNATMARIAEIEARIGSLMPPRPPALTPAAPDSTVRPFDVALGQQMGNIQLHPLNGGAGPFAPTIETFINKYAAQNGLAPDLVRAVIQQESSGDPKSRSAVGAMGLMQIMPETAQTYGIHDAYDPEQNIAAGTRHLAGLLREFNGDIPQALAAYNAGSEAVRKYGGVPPYAETQQYVQRIMGMIGKGNR